MLDPNLKDIIAKAYAKLGDISYSIALNMRKGKDNTPSQKKLYEQGIKMRIILRVLLRQITFDSATNKPTLYRLTEEQVNKFVRCLIDLGELNKYPVVPSLIPNTQPVILLTGANGSQGDKGDKGDQGATGLATDFSVVGANTTVIVDSFAITDAKAARWDYFVISNTGKQRASSIVGHWTPDGLLTELADDGADDLVGDTTGLIEFDINYSGGNIQLVATITSETWTIVGSRYFIPNNGNGTGTINGVLAHNNIYIGNSLDQAQARLVSGVISITDTGVVSFEDQSILDAAISDSANITLSKLASLDPNIVAVTDSSGKLISSSLSPTTLGYIDISSSLTTLLAAKLTDPLTTIGDLLIRDATNITARLGIGVNGEVLTVVGGMPVWSTIPGGISGLTTGKIPKASSGTTLVNSIISETTGAILIAGTLEVQGGIKEVNGLFLKKKVIPIGVWNMDTTSSVSVNHGLGADNVKIKTINVEIISDGNVVVPLDFGVSATDTTRQGYRSTTNSISVFLVRLTGGLFDSPSFSNAVNNRGYITIEYEA